MIKLKKKKSFNIPRTRKNFKKERQLNDVNTKMNQVLELFDKNFKAAIMKMLLTCNLEFSKQMKNRKSQQKK